jgi:hypothetical protein
MTTVTELSLDRGEKLIVARTVQDVEPILEHNRMLRSIEQKSDWGRHVASIPNVILVKWANEEYERGNVSVRLFTPEFDKIVERKLKDPEWAYLRTDMKSHRTGYGS